MFDRRTPRPRPVVTFPLNGHEVPIFGTHAEPFEATLRQAVGVVQNMHELNPQAKQLLQRITQGMTPSNAIWTFRSVSHELDPRGWLGLLLRERVESLGYHFTNAYNDENWDTPVAKLKRDEETILYVHRRGARTWVTAGDEVIIPVTPHGQRLAGSRRKGFSAYLTVLHPARPLRRAA